MKRAIKSVEPNFLLILNGGKACLRTESDFPYDKGDFSNLKITPKQVSSFLLIKYVKYRQ